MCGCVNEEYAIVTTFIFNSLYTEFNFVQLLVGLLIPCMSHISTFGMSLAARS